MLTLALAPDEAPPANSPGRLVNVWKDDNGAPFAHAYRSGDACRSCDRNTSDISDIAYPRPSA